MIENIGLKKVYSSTDDDILRDFYNPVLSQALSYDRITGYFSPKVLIIAARGISRMVARDGKIRIITSVQVDEDTYNILSSLTDQEASAYLNSIDIPFDVDTIHSQLEKNYLELFKILIHHGVIELRIAVTAKNAGILHQKIGIIKDVDGKKLSFSGSNNETVYGWTQNIEEFKVFPQWSISTAEFYKADERKFEEYWNNLHKGIRVVDFGEALKKKYLTPKSIVNLNELRETIEQFELSQESLIKPDPTTTTPSTEEILRKVDLKPLRNYQKEAIEFWRSQNYRGVFEMATGTGKTVTSINALKQLKADTGAIHGVVIVPLVTLAEQWKIDLLNILDDTAVIIASSANPDWRKKLNNLVLARKLGVKSDYIIVTTYASFGSQQFNDTLQEIIDNDIVIVGDEMHNIVTESNLKSLDNPKFLYRLGLSATPIRLWKQEESNTAISMFGRGIYRYPLAKALSNGYLVPYNYHIHPIHLDEDEYEEYITLSKDISRLSSYSSNSSSASNSAYTSKLIQRSRIKKQARNKLLALDVLMQSLRKDDLHQNSLIYADSEKYLSQIQILLTKNHIKTTKFTGQESIGARLQTIDNLRKQKIDAIIAIKCLDEGVDIPSAKTALFLSNNTDPREYVQRLGRVLRLDKQSGKSHAEIHDFLVLPPTRSNTEDTIGRNLVINEFKRAYFFKELCTNEFDINIALGDIMDKYGYYITSEDIHGKDDSEAT